MRKAALRVKTIKTKIAYLLENDEDLSLNELIILKESYKEALLIKAGLVKALPASELWTLVK